MTTRPISTLLRTSGQLLARMTGRSERPAERVRHLFFPEPAATAEEPAPAPEKPAPRGSAPAPLAPAASLGNRHHTVAYLALTRSGSLIPGGLPLVPLVQPSARSQAPTTTSTFLPRPELMRALPRPTLLPSSAKTSPLLRPESTPGDAVAPAPDMLEKTLRFQPSKTGPLQASPGRPRSLRWTSRITPAIAALLLLTFTAAARADSRPDFNRDAKPILRSQPQLLHYVKVHFDVQETGYARTPGDESHAPPPPYIFRAKPHGASGPYTITLFIQPGAPGHILYVKKTGPLAGEQNPPASAYPPGDNAAPFSPTGEPPASTPSAPSSTAASTPNGFVGVDSSTPSGPIKSPSGNATAPDLAPPAETAPVR